MAAAALIDIGTQMPLPQTYDAVLAAIERHVDEAHRHVLRSATDPGRSLPRFKTKSELAQDQRGLNVLLALLTEVNPAGLAADQLLKESYDRIDGSVLAAEDTRIRRRLQGIPETAPQSLGVPGSARPNVSGDQAIRDA
jgi:hypothetical protein